MNSLARLGFILVGLWALLSSFRGVAYTISIANVEGVSDSTAFLTIGGIAWLILSVGPAILTLAFNRQLADVVFPHTSEQTEHASPEALLTAGVSVLGLYLIVSGASDFISAILSSMAVSSFSSSEFFASRTISQVISPLFEVAAGLILLFFAPLIVRTLSFRCRATKL